MGQNILEPIFSSNKKFNENIHFSPKISCLIWSLVTISEMLLFPGVSPDTVT